jgi:hypothetical protein
MRPRHPRYADAVPLLGTMSDRAIGERLNLPRAMICGWRLTLGIPAWNAVRLAAVKQERPARVLEMLQAGDGLRTIARALRMRIDDVQAIRDANGIPANSRRVPDDVRATILRLKAEGVRTMQIAREVGLSHATVGGILRDAAGIPRWRSGKRRMTTPIAILQPNAWRCLDCGARVSDATTCPNGHAAPWAVAA